MEQREQLLRSKVLDLQEEVQILRGGMLARALKRVSGRLPKASQLRNIRAGQLREIRFKVAQLCVKTRSTCMMMVWTPKLEGWERSHLSCFGLGALEK